MNQGTCSAEVATSAIFSSPIVNYAALVLSIPTIVWLVAYIIPQVYMKIRPVPDLKKRYNATWALVTGAGTGIGKSIAYKLASQGLNVVLVSLDDDFLRDTMKDIRTSFPEQEFRSVGVTFSPGVPYLDKIKEATKDIDVNIVFNNAGFITLGFLDQAPLGKLLANVVSACYMLYNFVSFIFLIDILSVLLTYSSYPLIICLNSERNAMLRLV
jgi:Short-chain dehydrogenases of various substrate specificities